MENIIKGLYKLQLLLGEEQINELKEIATMHRRFARIQFKIVQIDKEANTIIISAKQSKNPTEQYEKRERLLEIISEVFEPYLQGWKIHKNAFPYQSSPAEIVTPQWIQQQMIIYKVGAKYLSFDIGIPPTELSALINGHREMGIRTKGLFYYYFKHIEQQKGNK